MYEVEEILKLKVLVKFVEDKPGPLLTCKRCCLYGLKACDQAKCLDYERDDYKNGHYELLNA